jgi:hypothetical protein
VRGFERFQFYRNSRNWLTSAGSYRILVKQEQPSLAKWFVLMPY